MELITMTEQDVIRNFNASLSQTSKWGMAAQDDAVYNASNGKFRDMASVVESCFETPPMLQLHTNSFATNAA